MKPLTLTQIAAIYDLNFRTLLTWSNGKPIRVKADVKVKGKGKRQYSPAAQLRFLIVASMFHRRVSSKAIQRFLNYLDEYQLREDLFSPYPEVRANTLKAVSEPFLVIDEPALLEERLKGKHPNFRKDDWYFTINRQCTPQKDFDSYLDFLITNGLRFTLVNIRGIWSEMMDRLQAYAESREYVKPDYAKGLREAFANLRADKEKQPVK